MTPDQGTLGLFDQPPDTELLQAPRLIVEIGPGISPIVLLENGIIRPGDSYLGVENLSRGAWERSPVPFHEVQEQVARLGSERADRIEIIDIGRRPIPVMDQSVDEVVIANVLGILRIGFPDSERVIADAMRILKRSGTLSILENITPADQNRVIERLLNAGMIHLNKGEERDQSEALKYNRNGISRSRFAYLLKFGFPPPPSTLWSDTEFA